MSLRSWIGTTLAFGLTLGLAIVLLMRNSWSLEEMAVWVWVPLAIAVALSAIALVIEWASWLVAAAGALLVTSWAMLPDGSWEAPVVVALLVLSLARFSGMYVHTRWAARAVGAAAGVGLIWLFMASAFGVLGDGVELDGLAIGGLAALAGMVAIAWFNGVHGEAGGG